MNREHLERMSEGELNDYAKALGLEAEGAPDAAAKIRLIESKRERIVIISVIGMDFEIPVKRAHDQRIADLVMSNGGDAAVAEALKLMLGDKQFDQLIKACTDDDGTIDVEAIGLAYVKIFSSEELKNF